MTLEKEKQMVKELKEHLRIAKAWDWKFEKMLFVDGYLRALRTATNKKYEYSGTDIYIRNSNGECVYV